MINIDFDKFRKNPVSALLFLALGAITYLHIENKTSNKERYDELKTEYVELKEELKELEKKFIDCITENEKK